MATQTDTGQLKKLGMVLLALGIVMAGVGFLFTKEMWQVYAGAGAAVIGLGIMIFAMKKG